MVETRTYAKVRAMGNFVRKGCPEFSRCPEQHQANFRTPLWHLSAIERFWTGLPGRILTLRRPRRPDAEGEERSPRGGRLVPAVSSPSGASRRSSRAKSHATFLSFV